MAKREIGQRIGAILKATDDTVWMIGFGTYQGDHVPPEDVGGFNFGYPNPKLVMDDGTVVWGCECWWKDEARIRDLFGAHNVVQVDMAELRKPTEGRGADEK